VCSRRPASPTRSLFTNVASDVLEAIDDRARVIGGKHAGALQRFSPGLAAGDVLFDQTLVDGERPAELEDVLVGFTREAPGP
jgi:hypothetical protein